MSSRSHRSSHAVRPRSTISAPSTYLSALSNNSPSHSSKPRAFGITSSSSAYKRSPRPNYLVRLYERVRKLIRDFIRYARKNPLKIIMPLILALVGGGAITGLVKKMGGLQALGLSNMSRNLSLDQLIGAGHGMKRASDGFSGFGREGPDAGFDPWSMGKGAIKIASAFL